MAMTMTSGRRAEAAVCLGVILWDNYDAFVTAVLRSAPNPHVVFDLVCTLLALGVVGFHLGRDTAPGQIVAAGTFAFYGLLDSGNVFHQLALPTPHKQMDKYNVDQIMPTNVDAFIPDTPFNHNYAVLASTRILASLYIEEMGIITAAMLTGVERFIARLSNGAESSAMGLQQEILFVLVTVSYVSMVAWRRYKERTALPEKHWVGML